MADPNERKSAAQAMLAISLFYELLNEHEAAAINRAVSATDHDARQAATADIRAIRNFRSKVETLAEGQSMVRKQAPA